jgi:hypothetical protein
MRRADCNALNNVCRIMQGKRLPDITLIIVRMTLNMTNRKIVE